MARGKPSNSSSRGPQGYQGPQGSPGNQGPQGNPGVGSQGPQGEPGAGGSGGTSVLIDSTSYTILDDDGYGTIRTSGDIEITLPLAVTPRAIKFIKTDIGSIATITVQGSDTIEGDLTLTLNSQYDTVTLESDGVDTWVEL
jgi:hypothetical protein